MKNISFKKFTSNEANAKICLFLIMTLSFYFPIVASFSSIMQIPSTPLNISIRGVMVCIALYLIVIGLLKNEKISLTKTQWFLLLFWVYYIMRIQIDLWSGIQMRGYDNIYIYGFTYGNIFLSIVAILFWGKHINLVNLPIISLFLFMITNLCILSVVIIESKSLDPTIFMTRLHLTTHFGTEERAILNPITIGLHGELLFLTSLFHLLFLRKVPNVLLYLFILVGLILLFLGASRGPFLNCILISLILLIKKFSLTKSKILSIFKFFRILIIGCFGFLLTLWNKISVENIYLFERFTKTVNFGQTSKPEYRYFQYKNAWLDFLDSPIVGKHFVSTFDNIYPHNIILELLMALGITGTLLFFLFFIPMIFKLFSTFKANIVPPRLFIVVLVLPLLIHNLFSGSLYMSVELWLICTLFLCTPLINKKRIYEA